MAAEIRVLPWSLTSGRDFLTVGHCSRTLGYCFLEVFVGRQGCDGGDKLVIGGSLPLAETLDITKPLITSL